MHGTVFAVELGGLFFSEFAEYRVFGQWTLGVEAFDRFFQVAQGFLQAFEAFGRVKRGRSAASFLIPAIQVSRFG